MKGCTCLECVWSWRGSLIVWSTKRDLLVRKPHSDICHKVKVDDLPVESLHASLVTIYRQGRCVEYRVAPTHNLRLTVHDPVKLSTLLHQCPQCMLGSSLKTHMFLVDTISP